MATTRRSNEPAKKRRPPATTPEARENQVIAAAFDLAERQILEGTASSQVISHFLKLGSSREKLEQARLEQEVSFMKIKAEALESQGRVEELYQQAMDAFRSYQGEPARETRDYDD